MSGVSCIGLPSRYNGRSLSGMGFTWERWCGARSWLSKSDMNTYQTSIKTSILLIYLGPPHWRRYETPQGSQRTNQKGG